MAEAGVALALVVLVIALGWLPPLGLLALGAAVAAAGLLGCVVVGVAYHRRLVVAAGRRGALQPGWWWAPTRLHPLLDDAGRRAVLPLHRAGVAAVVLAFVGFLLVALAAAKAWLVSR
jgi:hypothetical protein